MKLVEQYNPRSGGIDAPTMDRLSVPHATGLPVVFETTLRIKPNMIGLPSLQIDSKRIQPQIAGVPIYDHTMQQQPTFKQGHEIQQQKSELLNKTDLSESKIELNSRVRDNSPIQSQQIENRTWRTKVRPGEFKSDQQLQTSNARKA